MTSTGSNALEIVSVSDPANPVHAGSIVNGTGGALLNGPRGVFVSGNIAYVASYDSSALEIVDVTDPANPVHTSSISDGGGGSIPCLSLPYGIFVSGNYTYVASDGSDALEIVDVTDPANPVHTGSLDNGGGNAAPYLDDPFNVVVSGNYAYVASYYSNALEIVDVTDPVNPVHKSSIADGGGSIPYLNHSSDVYISGDYAYMASSGSNALEIIDIGTITATSVNVLNPTNITCTLNLVGAVPDRYNVVVINPDGSFGTLTGGFTVIGAIPTPTPTPTPTSIPTIDPTVIPTAIPTFPTHAPTLTPGPTSLQPYDEGSDDLTPAPTLLRTGTITVNIGGNSDIYRANVTGTGHSGLIITGTVASGPWQGISPAPGIVYEYVDLVPARYATIEKAIIALSVPQSWLDDHYLTPQNIAVYCLTNSTWTVLPTTLVKSETGRSYYSVLSPGVMQFAITGDKQGQPGPRVQSAEQEHQTFGDTAQAAATPDVSDGVTVSVGLQSTEHPAQLATRPSIGFSSVIVVGAVIAGVIILIGLVVFVRRRF